MKLWAGQEEVNFGNVVERVEEGAWRRPSQSGFWACSLAYWRLLVMPALRPGPLLPGLWVLVLSLPAASSGATALLLSLYSWYLVYCSERLFQHISWSSSRKLLIHKAFTYKSLQRSARQFSAPVNFSLKIPTSPTILLRKTT
jgi:hypothetical protein